MPRLFGSLEGGSQVRTERNIENSRWTRPGYFEEEKWSWLHIQRQRSLKFQRGVFFQISTAAWPQFKLPCRASGTDARIFRSCWNISERSFARTSYPLLRLLSRSGMTGARHKSGAQAARRLV